MYAKSLLLTSSLLAVAIAQQSTDTITQTSFNPVTKTLTSSTGLESITFNTSDATGMMTAFSSASESISSAASSNTAAVSSAASELSSQASSASAAASSGVSAAGAGQVVVGGAGALLAGIVALL